MSPKEENLFVGYFPRWGAIFDSEEIGFVGDSVSAYIPYRDEWRGVQKRDVWTERYSYGVSSRSLEGPEPPLCIVIIDQLGDGEDIEDGLDRFGAPMVHMADDAVLTLRLIKSGWLHDPKFSEIIFKNDGINCRLAGCYRQIFLAGISDVVTSGYNLSIDELAKEPGQETQITRMWHMIRRYRQGKPHASADIAIENFTRSYGYSLTSTHRAAFLFTALDAMFGGMSSRNIGKVVMNSKFRDRLAAALQAIKEAHPNLSINASKEAKWLDSRDGGRRIRNSIAHGRPSEVAEEAEKNYERIQSMLRLLLRQFLEFSITWAGSRLEICRRLDIHSSCAPVAAYNLTLEAYAKAVPDASEILRFDIPD